MDIAVYNQCYNQIKPYQQQTMPILNDDTVFLINVLKDGFRKTKLQVNRKDLIQEVCKHDRVADKLSLYCHLVDWLVMEARHQVAKESPKCHPATSAFVDISHVKTAQHLQFGREV